MRWILAAMLALVLTTAEAALPKGNLQVEAETGADEIFGLTWDQRYVLYLYYCPLYQQERRIRWIIRMPPNHVAIFQRWSSRKREQWWMFVSDAVGCVF